MQNETTTIPRPEGAPVEEEEYDWSHLIDLIPPYVVILWNDPVNTFGHVIKSLVTNVGKTTDEAQGIAVEAHENGKAGVIVCPKETAEFYCERLTNDKLTVSMEPA